MDTVIEVEGLRKEYRRVRGSRTVAVDGLDLAVPRGGVFGFLGPNGAGKTTTIRCLLGLVRPTGGRCRLLGQEPAGLHKVIGRVGSIVESPAMYPRFSARRNLELLGRISGIGRTRVGEVLEEVGLAERADDQVKTYSLGMKQRLGIAGALLKDPEVLILDEPANGLDPAGIVEVRELMRRLGSQGRTVFVSSHILNEVQQTADRVAILAKGKQVATGPVHEVLTAGHVAGLLVRLDDVPEGLRILGEAGIEATADDGLIRVGLPPAEAARVTRTLADRGPLPHRAPRRRGRPRDRLPRAHGWRVDGGRAMTGLLASEFRRFRSRRLVKVLVALELLAIVATGVIVFLTQEYALVGLPDVLMGTSLVLVSVGWMLGASAIGADWHAGHLTTILTWEPRRGRVLFAKIAAALTGVFVLSLVIQALLGVALAAAAAGAGSTAGADSAWLAESAGVALRVAVLSTIFAGFGFGLASAGRNTAVALGVGFGYLVIVENLVRGLRPQWTPWLLTDNSGLFILGSPIDFPQVGRSTVGAGLYLAAVGAALLLAAAGLFRARDVN